ncbi:MAG: DUF89 family protein [Chitinispirillaceae bacterium]|nr:DUF89 family protein [Chitinispirillaceae bacterium]
MRTYFECLSCFVNQALGSLKNCDADDDQIKSVMRSVLCELAEIDYSATPPVTAQKIHRLVSKAVGARDPYASQKQRYNLFATELLTTMQKTVDLQQDTLAAKVKLAIAANIIDFGKNNNLTENEVQSCFEKAMGVTLDSSALENFREIILEANSILFLCDNAGEIVFDRFLIEEMPYRKITCVVRGKPVINDATLEDAQAVGLTEIVKVIPNGSDAPGTIPEDCSSEFKQLFDNADLIIAKGQGNFETLSGITNKRIFFLFQVKCPVIARDAGYPVGSFVVKDNRSQGDGGVTEYPQSIRMEMKNG